MLESPKRKQEGLFEGLLSKYLLKQTGKKSTGRSAIHVMTEHVIGVWELKIR
jgi:hypothetical protein